MDKKLNNEANEQEMTGVEIADEQMANVAGGAGLQRYKVYTVEQGDTLVELARRFRTTVQAIKFKNPIITDDNKIRSGWVLNIPDNR